MTDHILTDLSPAALAAAVRANLYSYFRRAEASSAMDFARFDGFERWESEHPYVLLNGALSVRDATEGDACDIDTTLEYFREARKTAMTWWLEDGVAPEGWRRLLTERGFMHLAGRHGMALDLDALPEAVSLPDGASVDRATHADNLRPWARIVTRVLGWYLESERATFEWAASFGVLLPTLNYLAYFRGRPVGASTVHFGAGVAGVYNVCVEPQARRHGLGAALVVASLLEARELGYRAAVVAPSDAGLPLFEHLGFRRQCRVDYFFLGLSDSAHPAQSPICDAQARLAGTKMGTTSSLSEPRQPGGACGPERRRRWVPW